MDYLFTPHMEKDVPKYVDMLESLKRGAPVLYDSPKGMLIYEKGNACILGSVDVEEGKRALAYMPDSTELLVVRDERLRRYALEHFGFGGSSECAQIYYAQKTPPKVDTALRIAHPRPYDWDTVKSAYHLIDEVSLHEHFLSEDFFCGYMGDALVGFAGLHSEGAMGMLYVLPQYRRKGYAEALSAYLVGRQLARGHYAYAHVFIDNEASLALQRKTNMTFAEQHVFWLWRGDET